MKFLNKGCKWREYPVIFVWKCSMWRGQSLKWNAGWSWGLGPLLPWKVLFSEIQPLTVWYTWRTIIMATPFSSKIWKTKYTFHFFCGLISQWANEESLWGKSQYEHSDYKYKHLSSSGRLYEGHAHHIEGSNHFLVTILILNFWMSPRKFDRLSIQR